MENQRTSTVCRFGRRGLHALFSLKENMVMGRFRGLGGRPPRAGIVTMGPARRGEFDVYNSCFEERLDTLISKPRRH